MDGASAATRSTMSAPNARWLVEFIDLHDLAAEGAVAAGASRYDFRRVLFFTHEGIHEGIDYQST